MPTPPVLDTFRSKRNSNYIGDSGTHNVMPFSSIGVKEEDSAAANATARTKSLWKNKSSIADSSQGGYKLESNRSLTKNSFIGSTSRLRSKRDDSVGEEPVEFMTAAMQKYRAAIDQFLSRDLKQERVNTMEQINRLSMGSQVSSMARKGNSILQRARAEID